MVQPTDAQINAAADFVYNEGLRCGWWGDNPPPSWHNLDPIGEGEWAAFSQELCRRVLTAEPEGTLPDFLQNLHSQNLIPHEDLP